MRKKCRLFFITIHEVAFKDFCMYIFFHFIFNPFSLKILFFDSKFYFVHIKFLCLKKRELMENNIWERKLLIVHITTTKITDLDINEFHLIKTIIFRHFSHLFFIEKVDRSSKNILFKLFLVFWSIKSWSKTKNWFIEVRRDFVFKNTIHILLLIRNYHDCNLITMMTV
jgi:hypothetical protein